MKISIQCYASCWQNSDWKILMSKHECSQLMHIKFIFEEPLYRNCIALYLYLVEVGYCYLK